MSIQITQKVARELQPISLGYCEAWNLLRPFSAVYYTAGIYGWNADLYCINGNWISTGYRPNGTRPKESLKEYEERAKQIIDNRENDRETIKKLITELRGEYFEKIGF